ncbi:2-dehydropantoate 2-reductase [Jhaorihella thermophila]|uniref:2-dehydropantoate 2-reductase n=1 Tax=Jhaorihella thermophila TaxID=488547 RepID=A0A1H5WZ19_9RHOB|nr:2-dehydropantoate 2-reductase [Jhaorihella thermophila]SEG04762.1 2-dehydropantoate 2-reductase [Jhaorihella thermophila]
MPGSSHIVVAGAGSIGCFVGGLMAAGGHRVTLLGRARILDDIRAQGLHLTDFAGLDVRLPADRLALTEDPAGLTGADVVLVTVKTPATPDMARLIADHAPPVAVVVSLQNGVENADLLRAALPGRDVRAGMVPFNVVPAGPGRWHRASSGDIVIGAGQGGLAGLLSVNGLPVSESPEIAAIQWGKLLMNLNNALNALSGLPLRAQLMDRDWRRLMADQMAEALAVLAAAGIPAKPATPIPLWLTPRLLCLPTFLFARIAARALTIDAEARSSMAHDLMQRRPTEIDSLQGRIIALGARHGVPTPICRAVAGLVRRAESGGPACLGVGEIRAAISGDEGGKAD